MAKIAINVFSDTKSIEAPGKVSNAFVLALEAIEYDDELDEYKNHPSLRNLIVEGYQIISF